MFCTFHYNNKRPRLEDEIMKVTAVNGGAKFSSAETGNINQNFLHIWRYDAGRTVGSMKVASTPYWQISGARRISGKLF